MRWSSRWVWLVAALAFGACSFETADGTVESGNEALAEGKVDEAVTTYAEAATRIPESAELNFDRGLAASLAGDHASAASFLLQALGTKDERLEQKVKSALGTAYAREALALERVPPPEPPAASDGAPPPPEEHQAPKIPEAAMEKWKLAVSFLEDALVLDPNDAEARRSLEVALLRVDPPCATREDRFEDNDAQASAKPIEVKAEEPNQSQAPDPTNPLAGEAGEGAASEAAKDTLRFREQLFACPDDDDWYTLELAAGDRVELAPTVPKDAGRLAFELLRPDGASAWRWTSSAADGAPRHAFTVLPEQAGKWLVHQANLDFDEVSYGLEVVVKPACDKVEDRYEENDEVGAAKTLTPGPVPDLKLCPADEDWYALTLAEGESLFLYAQPAASQGDDDKPAREEGAPPPPPPFAVEVLDEAGTVRASGAPIDKSLVSTLLMPGAGRYFVRVRQRDAAAPFEGRYALQVEIVPPCPDGDDRFEDNDLAVSATDLMEAAQPQGQGGAAAPPQQQGPPVVFARVCPGDVDWWKVTSDGKTPQVLSAVFDHGQGDLSIELFDEAGATSLATSDASSAERNGEAVALPLEKPPEPDPAKPDAPAPEPTPKTFTLKVAAKEGAQNFYLLRLDQPSGGGGDSQDQSDEPQDDSKDEQQDKDDQRQDKDSGAKDQGKDEPPEDEGKGQQNPLQDALDNLDRNPDNLPARDAAKKSPLANQKPLKDW